MLNITLSELAGGAVQERFNLELEKVLTNCMDTNTGIAARGIDLKIKLKPNQDRDDVAVEFVVNTKMQPANPIETRLNIGKQGEKVLAQEHKKGQLAGQTEVDPETGEVKTPLKFKTV